MMKKKFNIKGFNINVDQKYFWSLVIYGGIIFLVALVGIFPLYKYNSSLIERNKEIKNQIDEQKELGPVYSNLLKNVDDKRIRVFPSPEKTTIPRTEAGKFQDDFRAIAGKAGLTIISFTPDINTLAAASTSFLHSVVLKGEFVNLRKLLIGLGSVPYLDKIEEINIQQQPYSMEFRMKIWIAVR